VKAKRFLMLVGALLLSLIMVVPMVAACAGETPAPTTTAPAPTTTAPAPQPTEQEVYNWKMQAMGERGTWFYDMFVNIWEKPIEEMSGGRIQIETFGRDELVPSAELPSAIQAGTLALTPDSPDWHTGTIAGDGVSSGLPGAFPNYIDVFYFYYWSGYMDWKQDKVFDPMNIKLLCPMPKEPWYLWTNTPLRTIDDFKGLKIRSPGLAGSVLDQLGVKMVEMAGSEVYMGGMTGLIDGATRGGISEMGGNKYYEPFPYILGDIFYDHGTIRLIMNLDIWNSLPDDLQAILTEGLQGCGVNMACNYIQSDQAQLQSQLEEGLTKELTHLDSESLAKFKEAKFNTWDLYAETSALNAEAVELLRSYVDFRGY